MIFSMIMNMKLAKICTESYSVIPNEEAINFRYFNTDADYNLSQYIQIPKRLLTYY